MPSLQAGDLIAEQYEVKGALAYGGLGWIYLAFDNILSRYVVLKGLLNVHDTSSAAAAVAMCVTAKAIPARPLAALAEPALKPNQPTHSREAPITA